MKAIRTTGETAITWTRVSDGLYASADGRYEISRTLGTGGTADIRWVPYYMATRDGAPWNKRLTASDGRRTLADAKGECSIHADKNGEQA